MSLYTHVRNKDDLLDGMVEAIVSEIPTSLDAAGWKTSLRRTVLAARSVILRHPWAPDIIESRTAPGPALLQYFNAVIGILREGGTLDQLDSSRLHLMGSRVLGFAQDPHDDSEEPGPEARAMLAGELARTHPYVAEMALAVSHEGGLGGCDDDAEFEFALDFILDWPRAAAGRRQRPGNARAVTAGRIAATRPVACWTFAAPSSSGAGTLRRSRRPNFSSPMCARSSGGSAEVVRLLSLASVAPAARRGGAEFLPAQRKQDSGAGRRRGAPARYLAPAAVDLRPQSL
jgi:AcrR family transcriptional regulator